MQATIAKLAERPNLWPWLLLTPLAIYLAVFFLVPLANVVFMSFTEPRLTLANYERVLTGALYQRVFVNTFATAALVTAVQKAGNWHDALRHFVPEPQKLYTWWSYRAPDWAAANKGRRLDHIWVAPNLADRLSGLQIARESRGWERPSDHVPVTATLEV